MRLGDFTEHVLGMPFPGLACFPNGPVKCQLQNPRTLGCAPETGSVQETGSVKQPPATAHCRQMSRQQGPGRDENPLKGAPI